METNRRIANLVPTFTNHTPLSCEIFVNNSYNKNTVPINDTVFLRKSLHNQEGESLTVCKPNEKDEPT